MQNAKKPKNFSPAFSAKQIDAAIAAAPEGRRKPKDWSGAIVSRGGGVAATVAQIRRVRGKNKNPTKEQVAIRFDPEVLEAFRADGAGWQTRMNAALKEWLAQKQARRVQAKAKG
jgi:uncharacterized protein (DUF4415 family)